MDNLLLARLGLFAIAAIELGVVYGHMTYIDVLPKYSAVRLAGWALMMVAIVGGTIAQILAYRSITGRNRVADDLFLIVTICFTDLAGIAVIAYTQWQRRSG